jgi:glutathione S-transferase
MKLLYTPRSPYVRKVRVVLIETGLHKSTELIAVDLENPVPLLGRENPLGKVPTLIRNDGMSLFDSPVICEYLDSLNTGPRLYPDGEAKWVALRHHALADGILDALTARRHEARRPENERSADYMRKQKAKSEKGISVLEQEVDRLAGPITIGQIAVGCCLGYLDFRFAKEPWRSECPRLATWFEEFAKRLSMVDTTPPAGGH